MCPSFWAPCKPQSDHGNQTTASGFSVHPSSVNQLPRHDRGLLETWISLSLSISLIHFLSLSHTHTHTQHTYTDPSRKHTTSPVVQGFSPSCLSGHRRWEPNRARETKTCKAALLLYRPDSPTYIIGSVHKAKFPFYSIMSSPYSKVATSWPNHQGKRGGVRLYRWEHLNDLNFTNVAALQLQAHLQLGTTEDKKSYLSSRNVLSLHHVSFCKSCGS